MKPHRNKSDIENFSIINNKDVNGMPPMKKRKIADPRLEQDSPYVIRNPLLNPRPANLNQPPQRILQESNLINISDDMAEIETYPSIFIPTPPSPAEESSSKANASKFAYSAEDNNYFSTPKSFKPPINFKSFNLASIAILKSPENIYITPSSGDTEASNPSTTPDVGENLLQPGLFLPSPPTPPLLNLSSSFVPPTLINNAAQNALSKSNYFPPPINSSIADVTRHHYEIGLYIKFYEDIKKLKLQEVNQVVMDNIRNGIKNVCYETDYVAKLHRDISKKCDELNASLQNEYNSHQTAINALGNSHKKIFEILEENKKIKVQLQDETEKYNNILNSLQQELQKLKENNDRLLKDNQNLQKQNNSLIVNEKQQKADIKKLNEKLIVTKKDRNREFQNRMEAERKLEDESKKVVKYLADKNEANKKSQQLEGEVVNLKKLLEKKEEQMNKMEIENKNLTKKMNDKQVASVQAKFEVIEAQNKATAAKNELKKLKNEMEKTIQQVREEKEEVQSASAELNRKKQVLNKLFSGALKIRPRKSVLPPQELNDGSFIPLKNSSNQPSSNPHLSSSSYVPAESPSLLQPQQSHQGNPMDQQAQIENGQMSQQQPQQLLRTVHELMHQDTVLFAHPQKMNEIRSNENQHQTQTATVRRPMKSTVQLINMGSNRPNQMLPNNHGFGVPNITAAMYELNPTTLSTTLKNI